MASPELSQAITAEQELLQEFGGAQTPEEFRAIYRRFFERYGNELPSDTKVEPISAGGVPAEWVTPANVDPNRVVIYLHGGGYLVGGIPEVREMVVRVAGAAQARALIIDYRLAPEHPHPAAVEDAVTAYRWLLDQGIRPQRIAVAGESAGGSLTLALLLALRDQGLSLPAVAVPISPWVDLAVTGETVTTNEAKDPLVKRELLENMSAAYLNGQDPRMPLASPLYADLHGLPPLLIQVGSAETLLDDARRVAERAKEAGVDVTYEAWDEMIHLWQFFPFLPEARQSTDRIGQFIREHTS